MHYNKKMRSQALRILLLTLGVFCTGISFSKTVSTQATVLNTANYDTAWTFLYAGGRTNSGAVINDNFHDVKILPNGDAICVGETGDSTIWPSILMLRLSPSGKIIKRGQIDLYKKGGGGGSSVLITKNGDFLVGGYRSSDPFLVRFDSQFNIKWATWYYDSLNLSHIFSRSASINALVETKNGRIIAAAGDIFPEKTLNYAAYLAFDSLGVVKGAHQWLNTTGYDISGWSIAESETDGFLMGGKQALFDLDTLGRKNYEINYTFNLAGVGTETSNISRVHRLRSGTVMVAGQTYEDDCWTRYKSFSYDAWWTPLSAGGDAARRYTTGVSGEYEIINDFTQLLNGNIVFVGSRVGGVWCFVTDSTGQNILWEKSVRIPYKTNDGSALEPLSVAATPDSGFTVVGRLLLTDSLGGEDAFAAHYVPKPVPVVLIRPSVPNLHQTKVNRNWVFTFDAKQATTAELRLYTVQGQLAGRFTQRIAQPGQVEIKVEASQLKAGMYLGQFHVGTETTKGFATIFD